MSKMNQIFNNKAEYSFRSLAIQFLCRERCFYIISNLKSLTRKFTVEPNF